MACILIFGDLNPTYLVPDLVSTDSVIQYGFNSGNRATFTPFRPMRKTRMWNIHRGSISKIALFTFCAFGLKAPLNEFELIDFAHYVNSKLVHLLQDTIPIYDAYGVPECDVLRQPLAGMTYAQTRLIKSL